MPNIKSAIKRVKIEEKKTMNNNSKKSEYKTAIRRFEKAVEENSKDVNELKKEAQKSIDHACTSGVISKNAASRKVSRLEKKLAENSDKKETKKEAKKEIKKEEKVVDNEKAEKKAEKTEKEEKKETPAKKTSKKASKKEE